MANNGLLAKRLANANNKNPAPTPVPPITPHSQPDPEDDLVKSKSQDAGNKFPFGTPVQTSDIWKNTEPDEAYDSKKTEAELEIDALRKQRAEKKKNERWKLSTRIVNIFLVTACIYVLFLIYGVAVTDYQYISDGTIKPQTLSISDIKDKKSFELIYHQYLNCRNLYEKVLILDYRLGKGEEDPLTLAPEYETLLDDVTDLSVKTDALEVDSQYSQIKSLLLTWIKDDIAVYLQNMSAAISQNNEETANNALQDKDRVYSDFSIITQNIAATGENIKGVDITDVKEWTPEDFVDQEINGE